MSRPIRAILLLIMIFVAASGIPLYADTFDFQFEFPRPFISSEGESITVDSTNITMVSPSHPRLEMTISADKKNLPLQFNETNPIAVSLYLEDNRINTFEPRDVSIAQSGDTTTIQVDLPQELLDVPNGEYELEISLNIENLQTPVISDRVSISYYTKATYIEALQSINRNETALTLYFPDNNVNYLIPITRIIPYTRTPLRSTIDNLVSGPKKTLGLLNDSPVPTIQKLNLNRRIANVYLPKDIGIYEEYSSSARIAVESFVNSLGSINEVDAVQFYFDNKIINDGFHGRVMNEPIYPSTTPKLYVGYITNTNRILLTPISLDTDNITIDDLFNGLKHSSNLLPYNYTLQPTVPEEVKLLNYNIEDTNLQLKLNDAFITAYADNPDNRNLMIESILYTLTSLKDITSVEFQVEGFTTNVSEEILINQPITPSPYINPEQ